MDYGVHRVFFNFLKSSLAPQSTYGIYLEYLSVCPLVQIGTPHPLPPSECVPLPENKGGGGEGNIPAGVWVVRGSKFGRQEKKPSTLSILWLSHNSRPFQRPSANFSERRSYNFGNFLGRLTFRRGLYLPLWVIIEARQSQGNVKDTAKSICSDWIQSHTIVK